MTINSKSLKNILFFIFLFSILSLIMISRKNFQWEFLFSYLENHNVVSPVLFIISHIIAAALFLPCSPFTVAAGVLWGPVYGAIFSIFGAAGSAGFTFFMGRYFSSLPAIKKKLSHPKIKWVFHQIDKNGWKVVAFTQVNPIFPASTLGYVYGLTKITFKSFMMATLIFMLPLQIAFVSVGGVVNNLIFGDLNNLILLIVSFCFICIFIMVKFFSNKLIMKRRHNDENI